MDNLAQHLVTIVTADSLDSAAALAVQTLPCIRQVDAACLLLWDTELERYIVGDLWAKNADQATTIRRKALQLGIVAFHADPETARCIEPAIFYQPLNLSTQHVGALLCFGWHDNTQPDYAYRLFIQTLEHTLATITRLEQANQERDELHTERQRLEQLLIALEDQQRTIDRLLAAEKQFSASLEAKVEERTAALHLAQNRLIQSEKLAVIGKLASSLAHELNNPLQAIRSGLGVIVSEISAGRFGHVHEDLLIVMQELERIEVIFRQMLDFYRPVSHQCVPLDHNAICEAVQVLMRKRLQQANITLQMDLASDLPLTCGDSNQIKQVLLNLMLNAAEAAPSQDGTITLKTEHTQEHVLLTIQDNGSGILPEHRPHLFEPLFTTKIRGLGLGLAISREIIERHGGTISVESTPGIYTLFRIALPIKETCHEHE